MQEIQALYNDSFSVLIEIFMEAQAKAKRSIMPEEPCPEYEPGAEVPYCVQANLRSEGDNSDLEPLPEPDPGTNDVDPDEWGEPGGWW